MTPAIAVDSVSFSFPLRQGSGSKIRQARRQGAHRRREVLRSVSLHVEPGEVLGIVGRNGSGKSTLIKLLAGVLKADTGSVHVQGRVAPMVELGAGFEPELTVAENVVLLGTLLGRSSRVCRERLKPVLDWAQLTGHESDPVRTLSSGMVARLAFSVATDLTPDVLLIDEVFSVGDAQFQEKSTARMNSLLNSGCAAVFVSHDLVSVRRLCQRAIWLEHGAVVAEGDSDSISNMYMSSLAAPGDL